MDDSIFYTFSTIPQVLGAAIALLGVFVLYKIKEINDTIFGNGRALLDEFNRGGSFRKKVHLKKPMLESRILKSINKNSVKELRQNIEDLVAINKTDSLEALLERIDEMINHKKKLLKQSKNATILTLVIIVLSVSVLPFAKIFPNDCLYLFLLFGIGILLLAINLIQIVRIMYKSIT